MHKDAFYSWIMTPYNGGWCLSSCCQFALFTSRLHAVAPPYSQSFTRSFKNTASFLRDCWKPSILFTSCSPPSCRNVFVDGGWLYFHPLFSGEASGKQSFCTCSVSLVSLGNCNSLTAAAAVSPALLRTRLPSRKYVVWPYMTSGRRRWLWVPLTKRSTAPIES